MDVFLGSTAPVISIVAPPGYGKTTLMGQFHAEFDRASSWLTLDEADNDPAVLLSDLAGALAHGGMMGESALDRLVFRSDAALIRGVSDLLQEVLPNSNGVIFIDHLDALTAPLARDVVGELLSKAGGSPRVVIASRSGAGLPIPTLRSYGSVVEITMTDLAMSDAEAKQVFDLMGVAQEEGIEDVMARTEGWPAALYLAGLAIKAPGKPKDEQEIHGNDVYFADYLRQQLYDSAPIDLKQFLTRSSVLPRMSGPLCDFVLDREQSATTLRELEDSNLLIVPMDHHRTWYRYHTLLQDFLREELRLTEPKIEAELHSRAATWFEKNGYSELAVGSARLAGSEEHFADLVTRFARETYAIGRVATLRSWMDDLEKSKTIARFPELAALSAFLRALEGEIGGAERMSVLALTNPDGSLRDDRELGPFALMYRSLAAARGVDHALADAEAAREAIGHNTEWIHVSIGTHALATLATSGLKSSQDLWTLAHWHTESISARPFDALAKGIMALISIREDDWEGAEAILDGALSGIRAGRLEAYPTSGLVFALLGRIMGRRGDIAEARTMLAEAAAARPKLTAALPVLSVVILHEMALTYMALADMGGARRIMRDAADILALRPRLGLLVTEHEEISRTLASLPAGTVGPSSLTTAELRLVPLLGTHLTYPQIGERLFLSRHTVKTQAMSIYRKLGVSSRSEAVEKARRTGLLGG